MLRRALRTKWLTEIPDKINKNIKIQEAHKIFRQKKRVLFKSKLEQTEIAYNNNNNNKDIAKWLILLKEKF